MQFRACNCTCGFSGGGRLFLNNEHNMKTKSEILALLAQATPSIAIETVWEHDEDERWDDPINADWTKDEDPDDWQCWKSEVRAMIIIDGKLTVGSAYLGGTWERYGDNPNPDISGYFRQMCAEALEDLPAGHPATVAALAALRSLAVAS